MKKWLILALVGTFAFCSCNSTDSAPEADTEIPVKTETAATPSLHGGYTLANMIPLPGDKELTEQDKTYIDESKERTIGKTKLTLNKDGSFTRVFPHPSGDGTTKTWEGTFSLEGDKLVMNINMNGEMRPLEFKVLGQKADELSLSSSFGQIDMNYVYKKQ